MAMSPSLSILRAHLLAFCCLLILFLTLAIKHSQGPIYVYIFPWNLLQGMISFPNRLNQGKGNPNITSPLLPSTLSIRIPPSHTQHGVDVLQNPDRSCAQRKPVRRASSPPGGTLRMRVTSAAWSPGGCLGRGVLRSVRASGLGSGGGGGGGLRVPTRPAHLSR